MPPLLQRQQLLPILEGIRRHSRRAALVVGFDGGSALLGHSSSETLFTDLVGPGQTLQPFRIRAAWERLDHVARTDMLRKHTAARAPYIGTLHCLAQMLREGYLTAVFACDPNRDLLNHLRADVTIETFDCAEGRPKVLSMLAETVRNGRDRRVVFVDTSDVFLGSIDVGCRGLEGAERREMKDTFRALSESFDLSFFWGWCDFNVNSSDIWQARQGGLYALGSYSDTRTLNSATGYTVVQDDSDGDQPTTEILDRIARDLRLDTPPPPEAGPPTGGEGGPRPGPPPPAQAEVGRTPPSCLLWPDETIERIRERGFRSGLSVVGVEGDLVRLRVAERVQAKLKRAGQPCIFRVCGAFSAVEDLLGLFRATPAAYCGIVVIVDGGFGSQEAPPPTLASAVDGFVRNLPVSSKKLFLFTPRSWIGSLQAGQLRPSKLHFESLLPESCATVPYLQRWLGTLPLLIHWRLDAANEEPEEEIRTLAVSMLARYVERAQEWNGKSLDFFHQALDFWYDSICSALSPDGDEPQDPASYGGAWERLLHDVAKEIKAPEDDFELGHLHRRPKPGTPPGDASVPAADFPIQMTKRSQKELGQ